MKKIAFIVQRYGFEVNGGAELHCRQLAEHLPKNQYDVTVLTNKAIDYMTWKDEYKADEEELNGIHVKRFSVKKPRNLKEFNKINDEFFSGKIAHTEREQEWLEKQGPLMPSLLQYLSDHKDDYDVFIFFTYLYYPTVMGINIVGDKAIVIPTAHDEPFLQMDMYRNVFLKPAGIFYNTIEEKELIEKKYGNSYIPNDIGGVGVEIPDNIDSDRFREKHNLRKYIIYVGRIDEGKNCHILFKYMDEYMKRNPDSDIKLVLMGKNVIPVPERNYIVNLGFVSDKDKFDGMAGAEFLVLPSEFESLSMVVLESLSLGVPVLVNGKCEVLKGHCRKGNAGLYYEGYWEFEGCMNYLLKHNTERVLMGENGKQYVKENYQWDVIIKKLIRLIDRV